MRKFMYCLFSLKWILLELKFVDTIGMLICKIVVNNNS